MIFHTPQLTEQELHVIARIGRDRDALRHQLAEQRQWVGLLRRVMSARPSRAPTASRATTSAWTTPLRPLPVRAVAGCGNEAWQAVVGYRNALTYVLQLGGRRAFRLRREPDPWPPLHGAELRTGTSPGRWRPASFSSSTRPPTRSSTPAPTRSTFPISCIGSSMSFVPRPRSVHGQGRHGAPQPRDDSPVPGRQRPDGALPADAGPGARGDRRSPFVSIEEYLGANTAAYYGVLQEVGRGAWHPESDARPWIQFVLSAHYRQAQTMLRRAEEAERRWTLLAQEASRLKLPERSVAALFNASLRFRLRNADYREIAEVNEHIAGRDLGRLVEAGLLAGTGRTSRAHLRGDGAPAGPRCVDPNRAKAGRGSVRDADQRTAGPLGFPEDRSRAVSVVHRRRQLHLDRQDAKVGAINILIPIEGAGRTRMATG